MGALTAELDAVILFEQLTKVLNQIKLQAYFMKIVIILALQRNVLAIYPQAYTKYNSAQKIVKKCNITHQNKLILNQSRSEQKQGVNDTNDS